MNTEVGTMPIGVLGWRSGLARLIIYAAICALGAEFLQWQAGLEAGKDKFNENSNIELIQHVLLFLSLMATIYSGLLYKNSRPLALLLSNFLFISFIREQDTYLDSACFDGAWQSISLFSLIFPIYYLLLRWKQLIVNLNFYCRQFIFGVMLSGMITTYVFSRLFGRKLFWMAVMEDRYFRDVKNVAEESIELFGYILILLASLEFIIFARNHQNK